MTGGACWLCMCAQHWVALPVWELAVSRLGREAPSRVVCQRLNQRGGGTWVNGGW